MWDQTYLLRHVPGQAYEDFDRVLDEAIERGYNTLRLDPLPQCVDLRTPDVEYHIPDNGLPFMPWQAGSAVDGPLARWNIEFMEKLLIRDLYYTLSAWWFCDTPYVPKAPRTPRNHVEAAEIWLTYLETWEERFGFDRMVYLDIHNEIPYFIPNYGEYLYTGAGIEWGSGAKFTPEQAQFIANDINGGLKTLRQRFPQLRFTGSIHGDLRWLDVPVEFECLDVHFYADADPRWTSRTRFDEFISKDVFKNDSWFAEFSDRCTKTIKAIGPMLRANQRRKVAAFAEWGERMGMPLTTSESWSSWFYFDHPDLDWGWLNEWSAWTVEDAIDCRMWGWTPHNYAQPQFANWKNAKWHRDLNERFLKS